MQNLLHSSQSNVCGAYCLYYVYYLFTNIPHKKICYFRDLKYMNTSKKIMKISGNPHSCQTLVKINFNFNI